jgi:hypothetical protein
MVNGMVKITFTGKISECEMNSFSILGIFKNLY